MKILGATSLLAAMLPAAALAAVPTDFTAALDANHYALQFDGRHLSGPGSERLLAEGRAADLFLFGENHGAAEIGQLAVSLYQDVSQGRPRRLVTEIGPATAAELEAMLREGSYRDFMAHGVHVQSVPFYFFEEEVPLAQDAVAAFPAGKPAIWGLDQEFMAGAPVVLRRLDALAATPEERAAVTRIRHLSLLNPFALGMGSIKPLEKLQAAFAGSASVEARKLTDQLVLGFKLYEEQGGDYHWSNERRETLLMENFEAYAAEFGDQPGPLFFKLGAYHMMRGESPTAKEALGLRLSRWAEAHKLSTLNIFLDCHGGKLRDALLGMSADCDNYLSGDADVFAPYLAATGYTLFDLRPLRQLPDLGQLPKKVQRIVNNYDYFLAVSNTHPSTFLPGHFDTRVYGGIILTILVLILTSLIVGLVILIRRWRRRRKMRSTA